MHKLDETYGAIHKLEFDVGRLGGGGHGGGDGDLEAGGRKRPNERKLTKKLDQLRELETKRLELEAAIAAERAQWVFVMIIISLAHHFTHSSI
jgi:hypothetical protein